MRAQYCINCGKLLYNRPRCISCGTEAAEYTFELTKTAVSPEDENIELISQSAETGTPAQEDLHKETTVIKKTFVLDQTIEETSGTEEENEPETAAAEVSPVNETILLDQNGESDQPEEYYGDQSDSETPAEDISAEFTEYKEESKPEGSAGSTLVLSEQIEEEPETVQPEIIYEKEPEEISESAAETVTEPEISEPEYIICPFCHRQLPSQAMFCMYCGSSLTNVSSESIEAIDEDEALSIENEPQSAYEEVIQETEEEQPVYTEISEEPISDAAEEALIIPEPEKEPAQPDEKEPLIISEEPDIPEPEIVENESEKTKPVIYAQIAEEPVSDAVEEPLIIQEAETEPEKELIIEPEEAKVAVISEEPAVIKPVPEERISEIRSVKPESEPVKKVQAEETATCRKCGAEFPSKYPRCPFCGTLAFGEIPEEKPPVQESKKPEPVVKEIIVEEPVKPAPVIVEQKRIPVESTQSSDGVKQLTCPRCNSLITGSNYCTVCGYDLRIAEKKPEIQLVLKPQEEKPVQMEKEVRQEKPPVQEKQEIPAQNKPAPVQKNTSNNALVPCTVYPPKDMTRIGIMGVLWLVLMLLYFVIL